MAMTKDRITLSGRRRTKELRQKASNEGGDLVGSPDPVQNLKQQAVEMQKQRVERDSGQDYIDDIVSTLIKKYEIWSEPLDYYRYKYSPNKRSQLLLNEIRCILNEHAIKLMAEGYQENTCRNKCIDLLNIVSDRLKANNIPIGELHLTKKRK